MGVYTGFGVNYINDQSRWDADIAYFRSIGLNTVRVQLNFMPIPWNVGTPSNGNYAYWRLCAQYFHNAGFWVTWGPNTTGISASNWQAYHDAVVAEANYLQQNNIVIDEFEMGNELEGTNSLNRAVTGTTISGTTVTITTQQAHNFITGELVTVYGFQPVAYNGSFNIIKTGTNTFTYSVASGTGSPVTIGSCYSMSIPQLHANLRQLATDVKAVYNLGVVSYGCYNQGFNGSSTFGDFIATGIGDMDQLSIHTYAQTNPATQTVAIGDLVYITSMINAFGNRVYISEFNLDSSNPKMVGLSPGVAVSTMKNFMSSYILNRGLSRFILFKWSERLNNEPGSIGWSQYYPTGAMNPMWYTFFQSNPTPYTPRVITTNRMTENGRNLITPRPLTSSRSSTYY